MILDLGLVLAKSVLSGSPFAVRDVEPLHNSVKAVHNLIVFSLRIRFGFQCLHRLLHLHNAYGHPLDGLVGLGKVSLKPVHPLGGPIFKLIDPLSELFIELIDSLA